MALNEFEGTVMLVSHDRALLRAVCDEFWMVGRGKVAPFDGDLDDYQKYLLEESKRLREVAKNAAREPAAASAVVKPAAPVQVAEPEKVAAVVASPVVSGLSSADQRKLDAQKRQQLAAQTRPLKRELEQNEQRMASIETEKNRLEALLTTPVSPAEMADAGRRLKALADEVATLEERWLELTHLLEATA
jgi:ATP-binding cassette subfamily F protein 3